METVKKRIWIRILILVAGVPLFLLAFAIADFAAYVHTINEMIFPNISINGVDVSYLTYDEALSAVDIRGYESRWHNAEVSVSFPDGAELVVTGRDATLRHNADLVVDEALANGRRAGIFHDSITYFRFQRGQSASYAIDYWLETDSLQDHIAGFVGDYNQMLDDSEPLVFEDRIVLVAGAGLVRACESELLDIVVSGLIESFSTGRPVERVYTLPDSTADTSELVGLLGELLVRPVSAVYDPETKTISQSVVGVSFDLIGAMSLISGVESGKTVSIELIYTQPEVTSEHLENLLFRDLIGECVTSIGGSANRFNNVTLAADAINGLVLEPGEEFSFNRVVGNRTYERGFRSAPTISGDQYVMSIGGGICQVSSTLYSAIKDVGLKVTERRPHSIPVSYLPAGRDATVSWNHIDFRFVNNTEYPLRLDVTIEGRILTVQVFGTIILEG